MALLHGRRFIIALAKRYVAPAINTRTLLLWSGFRTNPSPHERAPVAAGGPWSELELIPRRDDDNVIAQRMHEIAGVPQHIHNTSGTRRQLESFTQVGALIVEVTALLNLLRKFLFAFTRPLGGGKLLPVCIQGVAHSLHG